MKNHAIRSRNFTRWTTHAFAVAAVVVCAACPIVVTDDGGPNASCQRDGDCGPDARCVDETCTTGAGADGGAVETDGGEDGGAGVVDAGGNDGGHSVVDAGIPSTTVVINEVWCDGADDWVELVNTGEGVIALEDHVLTDDVGDLSRGQMLAGAVAPGAFVVVTLTDIGLQCDTETVSLRIRDVVFDDVVPQSGPAGTTTGRIPDGVGAFVRTVATSGASNMAYVNARDAFFDPTKPPVTVRLTVSPASHDVLASQELFGDSTYVESTISIVDESGVATPDLVAGIRVKGKWGSFRTWGGGQKSGLKVDLNRFDLAGELFGMKKFSLNNMVQDPTMVHEWMAYDIFRRLGVAAPRVRHATVELNGAPYGVMLIVEGMDGTFFDDHHASTVAVYEGEYGQDLDVTPAEEFDVDVGTDSTPLSSLIDVVAAAPSGDGFMAATAAVVNWDRMLRTMAVEIFIGHWDGYAPTRNNYFLHVDDAGQFTMLPWGTDQTFGYAWPLHEGGGHLFTRCMEEAACRATYDAILLEVSQSVSAFAFLDDAEALAARLIPLAAVDPLLESDPNEVSFGVDNAVAFLVDRIATVEDEMMCVATAVDVDGDGAVCSFDCNEGDPNVYVGAFDGCIGGVGNGVDDDCDGSIDNGPGCPDCVEEFALGRRYLVCREPRDYASAVENCEDLDADLAIIESDVEQAFVHDFVLRTAPSDYWLGMDDLDDEGVWEWNDGSLVDDGYTNWAEGEPNNTGEEDCGHAWGFDGTWNDIPCDVAFASVCEGDI